MLLGFLPLIVYALLSGEIIESRQISRLAASIVAFIAYFKTLKRGFILEWANLLMLVIACICVSILKITMIADYMGILIYLVLALVSFGSMIAGVPFIIQYAKDMVYKSVWDTPLFKSVNIFYDQCMGSTLCCQPFSGYVYKV